MKPLFKMGNHASRIRLAFAAACPEADRPSSR